jgi:hypothetical protein
MLREAGASSQNQNPIGAEAGKNSEEDAQVKFAKFGAELMSAAQPVGRFGQGKQ